MKKIANIAKIVTAIFIVGFVFIVKSAFKENDTPKTALEIKNDSLQAAQKKYEDLRKEKINYALTGLKEMIKDRMKDPDSFKLHQRIYDEKAKGDTIGLIIEYSGTNSYGARIREVAYGSYSVKEDKVWFTEKPY